jgi:hypothetical protein
MLNDVELNIYKELVEVKDNKDASIQNLIESCQYYKNGKYFLDFLLKLYKLNIDFQIIEGFKGRTQFDNNENKFITCVLLFNDNIINELNKSDSLKYEINDENNQIKVILSTNQ